MVSSSPHSIILIVCLLLCLFDFNKVQCTPSKVLVWMCLEICGDTPQQIDSQIQQIKANQHTITAVSFEKYTLEKGGVFADFSNVYNLTQVNKLLPPSVQRFPMLSSYPHPPEFIDYMLSLFQNPLPFIHSAISEAINNNYTGYNLDFEPTGNATSLEAQQYAQFLQLFSNEMHKFGKLVTVDVASWSEIWNFTLLGKSDVDRVITMDTYSSNFSYFSNSIQKVVLNVPLQKLGVGLDSSDNNYTLTDLKERFDLIDIFQIEEIDIWRTPIPEIFWQFFGFVSVN